MPLRCILLALLCAAAALAEAPPVMFRGDAAHQGVYAGPAPSLRTVAWTFRTRGRILSSPAVRNGTVFVGSTDHRIYALGAADGTLRWSFETQGPVNSSPAVAGGLVVVSSLDGLVYALGEADGKPRWTFRTGGERRFSAAGIHGAQPATEVMPDPFDLFLSSPVIQGGRVFIGSGDHHVYALDLATGALAWSYRTGDVVHASPAVADGIVYVGSWDRKLHALDAGTGAVRWTFTTGADPELHNQEGIAGSAAVVEGAVYFGCRDGRFYALDARSGALRWSIDNRKGWVIASPAVSRGRVCFPTSDGQRFKVAAAATGALLTDVEMPAISFSSPAVAGEVAFFGTSDGWLRGVDLRTGREVAAFQSEGRREHGTQYLDARGRLDAAALYPARTLDGMILGVDRMLGLGAILSSPVIADGLLYVGSGDGRLYALR